ncbi:Uncharacterised protein [uncultured Comamonas sp.]|nr:Uncharacterised protein [uncultured Comamonas sp.]
MNKEINDSDLQAAVQIIAALAHHDPRAANLSQLPQALAQTYAAIQAARLLIQEDQANDRR